jgi:D-arabinono-1,4-lactone oxidase
MTLHYLCSCLQTSGFGLPSLPILLHQSIGGAIATGSHGSSAHHGTVSDSVVAVRLVTTDGIVKTFIPQGKFLLLIIIAISSV